MGELGGGLPERLVAGGILLSATSALDGVGGVAPLGVSSPHGQLASVASLHEAAMATYVAEMAMAAAGRPVSYAWDVGCPHGKGSRISPHLMGSFRRDPLWRPVCECAL